MAAQAGNRMDPFPYPLPLGLFHLDPDPAPPADPPAADPPPADPPADRTFTQADVDRIVQERLARAKTQPPADYEDLKAAAAKLAELEQQSMSELEKERARADKAEADRQTALEAANRRLVDAAILAEAAAQKAIKPEHLHRLIDTDGIVVGDDGDVSGVKEAVEAFLKANPEYVARPAGADQGARDHGGIKQVSEAELKTMTPEQIDQAHREGRLAALLGSR